MALLHDRVEKYGAHFAGSSTEADIELMCFAIRHSKDAGGLGTFGHLKRAIDLIWNEPRRKAYEARHRYGYDPDKHDAFIWNDWTTSMMKDFCDSDEVIVAGPGASWKTTSMALFYLCVWASDPFNTRIILTSTTGDGLRARVWKELVHFYRVIGNVGNLVQSRTMIQTVKGDDGAGIFGIAVENDGNIEKAVNKIVGRHNRKMGVGVDEMPTVNGAIVEGCVNLRTGCERFWFTGVGNPDSHFDEHGKMAEPKIGWGSVSPEAERWETKTGGICIHLDGRRSPRNGRPEKFPGLIWQDDLDRTAARYGEDSPQMWKQRYGFWAPEGILKTVLSESDIVRFRARNKVFDDGGWVGGFVNGAGLDPAFEGEDRRVLRRFKVGTMSGGRRAMELGERFIFNVKVEESKENPVHYQILDQVKAKCEEWEVKPEWFGLDSTGEGGGLAAIFIREWSNQIRQIEFGGRASARPISGVRTDTRTKPKLGYEEYLNRVTELWYQFRVAIRNGQIRGMDILGCKEFCKREWALRGNFVVVESKKDMRKRTGESPDCADADVVCLATVLENEPGFMGASLTTALSGDTDGWKKLLEKYNVDEALVLDMSV
jgi:hypothetical protein